MPLKKSSAGKPQKPAVAANLNTVKSKKQPANTVHYI